MYKWSDFFTKINTDAKNKITKLSIIVEGSYRLNFGQGQNPVGGPNIQMGQMDTMNAEENQQKKPETISFNSLNMNNPNQNSKNKGKSDDLGNDSSLGFGGKKHKNIS